MAKTPNNLYLGISESEKVDSYMKELHHPLVEVCNYIRQLILQINPSIGEGIFWNAPTFYFTGNLPPFEPKTYKRYLVGFVLNKKDVLRLVFLKGSMASDPTKILEGSYTDGRRIITFTSIDDVKLKETALVNILHQLLKTF